MKEKERKGKSGEKRAIKGKDLIIAFDEDLVVFGKGNNEKDGSDIFKAVNPLATFGALTAHVHHAKDYRIQIERVFDNARRRHTHTQDVLQGRHVVRARYPLQRVQVTTDAHRA